MRVTGCRTANAGALALVLSPVIGADLQERLSLRPKRAALSGRRRPPLPPPPQIPQTKPSTAYEAVYFLSAAVVYFYSALDSTGVTVQSRHRIQMIAIVVSANAFRFTRTGHCRTINLLARRAPQGCDPSVDASLGWMAAFGPPFWSARRSI